MKSSDRFFIEGVGCRYEGELRPVANLSVGGFYLAVERLPMKGQTLNLELQLGARRTIPIVGLVTWVNQPSDPTTRDQPVGFGVKITRIGLKDKVALIDLLRRAEQGSAPGRTARS